MNARVTAICLSRARGEKKTAVPRAELRANHGIVGDAHAGDWHRQVSLLAAESIARMRAVLPTLADGDFAENIVTEGIDLRELRVGDRLRLGDGILLEVTQIGKECHHGCAIRRQVGDCIMPREGLFCRVLRGGALVPGDPVTALAPAAAAQSEVA